MDLYCRGKHFAVSSHRRIYSCILKVAFVSNLSGIVRQAQYTFSVIHQRCFGICCFFVCVDFFFFVFLFLCRSLVRFGSLIFAYFIYLIAYSEVLYFESSGLVQLLECPDLV